MKYYKTLGGVHGNYLNVLELPSTLCKPTLFFRIVMSDGAKKSGGGGGEEILPGAEPVWGWHAFFYWQGSHDCQTNDFP